MTIEQELERFYGDLAPDPEAERRVITAVTVNSVRAPRWRPVLAVALSATAIAVAATAVAMLRPGDRSTSQVTVTHGGVVASLVVPPARAGAVVGGVARDGRPVTGARVRIDVFPTPAIMNRRKPGDAIPLFRAGSARSDPQGGFTMTVDPTATSARYVDNGVLKADVTVELPNGRLTDWRLSIDVRDGRTEPMTLIFDVGRMTVTVNGETSTLTWTDGVSRASSTP